jgi:hypothetical protein
MLRATLDAPPGRFLGALDEHHRHRGFGRDAAHVAEPVAVEHHVAHDEHARATEIGEVLHRPIG